MRVDVVCRGMTYSELLACAQACDRCVAVPTLWFPESPGDRNPFVTIAGLGAVTSRARFATGVTPLPLRSQVDVVASVLTLTEILPSRFDLGVGSGNREALERAGVSVSEGPLQVVGRYFDLFDSVRASSRGPEHEERVLPRIILAAHNRQMIRLGAERADALLLNVVARSDYSAMARYARGCGPADLGMFQLTTIGPRAEALVAARQVLAGFMRSPKVRLRLRSFDSTHADRADELSRVPDGDLDSIADILDDSVVADFAALSAEDLLDRLKSAKAQGFSFVALSVFPVPLTLENRFPPTPVSGTCLPATLDAISLASDLAALA